MLRIALSFSVLALACGGATDGAPTTGPTDTVAAEAGAVETLSTDVTGTDTGIQAGGSYYEVQIKTTKIQQTYKRTLDEKSQSVAFGSTHIAPAVSLAVEDTLVTPFAIIGFNFGFVVGSSDHPITITGEGVWDWAQGKTNAPPGFKILLKDGGPQRTYVSWLQGAKGSYVIERWGKEEGDVVEASFNGTLVADVTPFDPTLTATVKGVLRVILPKPAGGQ